MRLPRLRLPSKFSRPFFRRAAKPIVVSFDGVKIGTLVPRENTTGSIGWHLQTKLQLKLEDVVVYAQLGLHLTVIGSASLPREEPS